MNTAEIFKKVLGGILFLLATLLLAGGYEAAMAQLSFGPPVHLPLPVGAGDFAVGDFNGDGAPDIGAKFTTGGGWDHDSFLAVFLGDGRGGFTGPTLSGKISDCYGGGATTADFNGDGKLDLAFTFGGTSGGCFGAYGTVHLGDGTGGFAYPPLTFFAGGSVVDVEAGDFDEDGNIDIVTTYGDARAILVSRGNGDGTFSPLRTYAAWIDVEVNDFNGDGNLDIAGASVMENRVVALLGDGRGGFSMSADIALSRPERTTSGDFNGDGRVDLAVAASYWASGTTETVSILLGNGDGTFAAPRTFPAGGRPLPIVAGDFDLDGRLDVAIAYAYRPTVAILLGDGTGNLSEPRTVDVGVAVWSAIRTADFNLDGRPDLAVTSARGLSVLLNTTAREITVAVDIKPGSDPNSINPKSRGKIPVAILSSADFDAPGEVDTHTLRFGHTGDEMSLAFCNSSGEDVNNDGLRDLVCHFDTLATGFEPRDTAGILKGQTVGGIPLRGTDSVRIVSK